MPEKLWAPPLSYRSLTGSGTLSPGLPVTEESVPPRTSREETMTTNHVRPLSVSDLSPKDLLHVSLFRAHALNPTDHGEQTWVLEALTAMTDDPIAIDLFACTHVDNREVRDLITRGRPTPAVPVNPESSPGRRHEFEDLKVNRHILLIAETLSVEAQPN